MGRSRSRRTKIKPPKKRQGRPSIYTDEQLEFLRPFVAVYLSLGHKKGDAFWQSIFPEFFRRWVLPNVDPDYTGCETDDDRAEVLKKAQEEAQNAARIQIKAWFSRQGQQQNKRSVWRKHIERTLRPKKGKPRAFTEATMYKYYLKMDDYKDKIDDAVEDALNGRELASKKVVALYCKVARELWEDEEDDVKERVRAAAAAYDAERISAYERACSIGEMSEEAKAEARANLASALKPWIRQVLEITGCTTGSFLLGLPPNDERPKVRCYTIHVGRTIPARGYQEYNEFDPETYRILMRSFGRFTHQTIDAPVPTDAAAPSSGSGGNNGNQLDGLLTFEHEEINISIPAFNTNGVEPGQSEQDRGSDGASTSTPRIDTPAADAQGSDLPSGDARGAASQTETPPSMQQPSQTAPHAPAGSSDPAGTGESQPSTTNAPEGAPGNVERPRPRPRPVVYDTPASFSSYLVNDFPLSTAFRALMQRLPPDTREQRLAIMKQWGAEQLKKANDLAESEAGLGPADSARDARVLKELFQYWEVKEGRSKARAPKKPTTRKRKRKAPVEEEEEWTDEEEDEYDERDDESDDESEEEEPSDDEDGSSSEEEEGGSGEDEDEEGGSGEDEEEGGDEKEGDEDEEEEGGGGQNEEDEGGEGERAGGSLRRSKRSKRSQRAQPQRAPTARALRSQNAATGAAAGPSHAQHRGDSATPAQQRDDSPAPQSQTNATTQGDGRADFEMREGALDTLRDAQSIAAPHSIHSEAVRQHLPAWMLNCFNNVKELEHTDDHPDVRSLFVKIVETWGEIERTQEYKQHGKQLSSEGRPPDVKAWIARARRTAYRPNLLADRRHGETDAVAASATFDKFRADMKTWWSNVNPAWRRPGDGSFALRRDVGDWSDLYCTGSNGIVSVVKALKWWWEMLEEVDEQPGDRDEWRAAAADVAWAFEQVLAHGKTLPSAASSPPAASSKPPKKRRRT